MGIQKNLFLALLILALGAACSSSHKSDTADANEEIPPVADAATDVIPDPATQDPASAGGPTAQTATTSDTAAALNDPALASPPAPDAVPQAAASPTADSSGSSDPYAAQPVEPSHQQAQADLPPPVETQAPIESHAPASNAAPVVANAGSDAGYQNYTVQNGDTLMRIAFENYGDLYQWRNIYDLNRDRIPNPNALAPGSILKLESPKTQVALDRSGEKYLIKTGDTLGTIAYDVYGTNQKWRKLWESNRQLIKDPNRIYAGFYLYYSITAEEREEAERLKQIQTPMVLGANQPAQDNRLPASTANGNPAQQAQGFQAQNIQRQVPAQGQAPVQQPMFNSIPPATGGN